jgi:hypothetical protein
MSPSRIPPRTQVSFLYTLAAVWYGIVVAATNAGKGFLSSLHLVWGILFFCIPVLYFYSLLRIAQSERPFIAKHPVLIFGALGAGLLPVVCFVVAIFS